MKKLLSGITTMVLVLGLFATGVQAKGNTYEKTLSYDQVVQMVEQTDKEIYEEIDKAKDEANILMTSDLDNKQVNKELDTIIHGLIKVTNEMVKDTIKEAAKSGFIVEPVLIEIQIGDRFVIVDPCRVVGF